MDEGTLQHLASHFPIYHINDITSIEQLSPSLTCVTMGFPAGHLMQNSTLQLPSRLSSSHLKSQAKKIFKSSPRRHPFFISPPPISCPIYFYLEVIASLVPPMAIRPYLSTKVRSRILVASRMVSLVVLARLLPLVLVTSLLILVLVTLTVLQFKGLQKENYLSKFLALSKFWLILLFKIF